MTTAIDEFNTMLALYGATRIPHMEAEIFADLELVAPYLAHLAKGNWWQVPDFRGNVFDNSRYAYYYARDVMRSRWPEAESSIKKSSSYWHTYKCTFNIN